MGISDSAYIRRFFSFYSQEEKDKVRGHAFYPSDYLSALLPAGVAHVHILRSPHARATFSKIDASEAEKLPGLLRVITAQDIPENSSIGAKKQSQQILPENEVRFRGQPVALIVAEDLLTAKAAAELVKVDWTPAEEFSSQVVETVVYEKGTRPDAKLEYVGTEFHFPSIRTRYLEPESGWVSFENGRLSFQIGALLSESQRLWLARTLKTDLSNITAREAYLGGQFGGRQQREMIAYLGISSWLTKRSCCLYLEYENQDMGSYGYSGRLEVGYDAQNSRMKHIRGTIKIDSGSFEGNSVASLKRALEHVSGTYDFQRIELKGEVHQTPSHPRRALKGEGLSAVTWVTEQLIDQVAKELKLDPLDFRLAHGQHKQEASIKVLQETEKLEKPFKLLSQERTRAAWEAKPISGRGFAFQNFRGEGKQDFGELEISVELQVAGTFVIRVSNHTLDLHLKSALAEVAASVLHTHPKAFTVEGEMRLEFDKPRKRETYPAFYYLAQCTWLAARDLKEQIKEVAQKRFKSKNIILKDGAVVQQETGRKMGYRELAFTHGNIELKRSHILTAAEKPHGCSAGAVSKVSFDPLTGELSVNSVRVILDAGPVVRKTGLEIEVESAVAWAMALLFSSKIDRDQPIPTPVDGPDDVQLITIDYPMQSYADKAPEYFGSRGTTDVLMSVVLASLVVAIQDARNIGLKAIPMVPELIYPEERKSRGNMIPFRRP